MHSECAASDAGSALAAAYRSLATLPLGRGPATSARWLGSHAVGAHGSLATVMPVTAGGVLLGTDSGGHPVAVRSFGGGRNSHGRRR